MAPACLSVAFGIALGLVVWRVLYRLTFPGGGSISVRFPGWKGRIRPWIASRQRLAGDFGRTPESWAGLVAACGAGGLVWGAMVGGPAGATGGLFFSLFPVAILNARAERRLSAVEGEFPFVVDLVGFAVAGGMTVEWAIRRIVPRLAEGPLKTELARLIAQRAVGQGWAEVLSDLAARTGSASVHEVSATLTQAESTGMSLAPILARLSGDLRARRLSAAEERAHRAPVRMLFPIVLCILPAVFAVLLGPVLHRLSG